MLSWPRPKPKKETEQIRRLPGSKGYGMRELRSRKRRSEIEREDQKGGQACKIELRLLLALVGDPLLRQHLGFLE
ncbi:hypothetical protein HPP92_006955 [Vanilla planifolia]|uniref:Uncharacterized protein n=1 Tax=Vanilla planifolia TaxID=51239 RepID=A0A835RQ88_VANPL|nr:hypothetical protein HPP92_006955 [Vanilla planifolia]